MLFHHHLQQLSSAGAVSRRQALLGLSLLTLSACSRSDRSTASVSGDASYYTCTMHPFVHSHDPKGKCPICGMDLTLVVNAATAGPAMAYIAPERQREIGVVTEVVTRRDLPKSPRALTISVRAALPTGLRYVVFVDHGGGYLEPREITLGVETSDYYEVLSGLSEGDRVVARANFLVDAESRIQGVLKTWGDRP